MTVGNVAVQDGKQGDLDPRPNCIGFNANVNGYFARHVEVTMLRGRLTFSLGTNDDLFLPNSASVSIVPAAPTLALLATALTWMA